VKSLLFLQRLKKVSKRSPRIGHHREYHPSRTRLICMKSLAMRGWSVRNVSLCVADTADKMSAGILGH